MFSYEMLYGLSLCHSTLCMPLQSHVDGERISPITLVPTTPCVSSRTW